MPCEIKPKICAHVYLHFANAVAQKLEITQITKFSPTNLSANP